MTGLRSALLWAAFAAILMTIGGFGLELNARAHLCAHPRFHCQMAEKGLPGTESTRPEEAPLRLHVDPGSY